MRVSCICARNVAVSCQSARPAGYHPPLTWSPLFQRKRALLRCSVHSLLSLASSHELARTQASFHVEGGGPLAVEDGELASSLEYPTYSLPSLTLYCQSIVRYVAVLCQLVEPGGYHPPLTRSPLFQGKRAFLRCTALPINCATLRCLVNSFPYVVLSYQSAGPGGYHPPHAVEDRELADSLEYLAYECATLHPLANQLDPPAITHRWRGPPSFRERGLFFVALP